MSRAPRLLPRVILPLLLGSVGGLWAAPAEAKGTHFILELTTGLGESAYTGGGVGLAYGASFGTTFKLKILPVRWYVLASVMGRNATISGLHEGISFSADRRDVDIFIAERTVLPIWKFVRIYAEVGVGQRRLTQTIKRSHDLGPLTESNSRLLVVLALGAQARVTERFSLGIRGELTPIGVNADLATYAADVIPTQNRISLLAQVGVHF